MSLCDEYTQRSEWQRCRRCAEGDKNGNLGRERVSDFKTELRTHPANHIPRNRQEEGGEG